MTPYITHRSKVVQFQRCPRSRYLLHEAEGTGYTLVRSGIDLIIGAGVHDGLADKLEGAMKKDWAGQAGRAENQAVEVGLKTYDRLAEERGFNRTDPVFPVLTPEHRFLTEGLIRLAARRVIPRLLEFYEILEVERSESHMLNPQVQFAFTPDALMRQRSSGDLYILSWKTAAMQPKESEVRVDMQGITETWGVNKSLSLSEAGERVRGVQMVYLIKGRKVDGLRDSPLLYGWRSSEGEYANSFYWKCTERHPMRKSKYYPLGECQGGKRHERKGEWTRTLMAEQLGVENWMNTLSNEDLDELWTLGVPIFRRREHIESYMRQVERQESRIPQALAWIREAQEADDPDRALRILDSEFPQNGTAHGCRTYNALCPAYEICFGSEHIAEDPIGSGIYQAGASLYELEEGEE